MFQFLSFRLFLALQMVQFPTLRQEELLSAIEFLPPLPPLTKGGWEFHFLLLPPLTKGGLRYHFLPPLTKGGLGGFGNIRTRTKFAARMLMFREVSPQLKWIVRAAQLSRRESVLLIDCTDPIIDQGCSVVWSFPKYCGIYPDSKYYRFCCEQLRVVIWQKAELQRSISYWEVL